MTSSSTCSPRTNPTRSDDQTTDLVGVLTGTLRQLHGLLEALSDEQYTRSPGGALESSTGGHVRHNLDHVAALLIGLPAGAVNYDRRERGTPVESDRHVAMATISRLERALRRVDWREIPREVWVTSLVAPSLPPVELPSSPERELAFVLSHTIHHNALISVIVAAVGATAPPGFGYAPATIAHRQAQTARLRAAN